MLHVAIGIWPDDRRLDVQIGRTKEDAAMLDGTRPLVEFAVPPNILFGERSEVVALFEGLHRLIEGCEEGRLNLETVLEEILVQAQSPMVLANTLTRGQLQNTLDKYDELRIKDLDETEVDTDLTPT